MTTTTQRQELTEMITMAREGIESATAEGLDTTRQVEALGRYEAQLAKLGGGEGNLIHQHDEGHGVARSLTARPKAGAPASNQYGTFTVAYASEKQTKYIGFLLSSRDLTNVNSSTIRATLDVEELRRQVAANQVNKKAASDIIDRLQAQPELPVAPIQAARPTARLASDKQLDLVKKLAGERKVPADLLAKVAYVVGGGRPTMEGTSGLIDALFAAPKVEVAPVAIEAGVYTDGTTTFRVYLGQNSGRMLAAKVVEHDGHAEFEYAGQADRFITSAFCKLTIEEAARFGKATGTCIVCARRLDVPESVDRGIGPVCYAKMQG